MASSTALNLGSKGGAPKRADKNVRSHQKRVEVW